MKIAVTHLTRMQPGKICAAGLDIETGRHVRPVLPKGCLQTRDTSLRGGPFDMATVVDLGPTRAIPNAPEVEDHELTVWHARAREPISEDLFWDMLEVGAKTSLRALFGSELRTIGRPDRRGAVVSEGAGIASLGVLMPRGRPRLTLGLKPDGRAVARMTLSDGDFALDLSVSDLRLYDPTGTQPNQARMQDVARRLALGVPVRLGVGLTRAFATRPGDEPVHWLQVNNLHLEDDPCWRLTAPVQARPRVLAGIGAGPAWDGDGPDDLPF